MVTVLTVSMLQDLFCVTVLFQLVKTVLAFTPNKGVLLSSHRCRCIPNAISLSFKHKYKRTKF